VLCNMQSNLAVEESCICGTHQLFHQQLLSQNCIYKINFHGGVPCTLRCELVEEKTLRLLPGHERWFTEVFHYSTKANTFRQCTQYCSIVGWDWVQYCIQCPAVCYVCFTRIKNIKNV